MSGKTNFLHFWMQMQVKRRINYVYLDFLKLEIKTQQYIHVVFLQMQIHLDLLLCKHYGRAGSQNSRTSNYSTERMLTK